MKALKIIIVAFVATLISACSPPQESAVENYLNAKTPAERYETICQSDQIELEDLNSEYKDTSLGNIKDIAFDKDESTKLDNKYYILATQVEKSDGSSYENYYHSVKHNGEWCVDWVSTSRTPGFSFNDMYLNGAKGGKGFFRVELSSYYNFEFLYAKRTHYSLTDIDFGKNYYLNKDSPGAKKIFNCVESTNDGYCIISGTVDYPATKRDSEVLLLDNARLIYY